MQEILERIQNLFESGKYQEALDESAVLRKHFKKSPEYWAFLGACEYQLGLIDKSEKKTRKALFLDPRNFDANNNLGSLLLDKGLYSEAIKYLCIASEVDRSSSDAVYNLAKVYRALGDIDKAKELFKKAISLNPKMAIAHNNLGNCLKVEGDLDAAISAYKQAINLNEDFKLAKWNLSITLLVNGDFEEGYKYYQYGFDLKKTGAKFERGPYIGNPNLEWDGKSKITNLIVWGEQGIGDELIFSKFLKYIPSYVSDIEVRIQKKMINLFRSKLNYDQRFRVTQRNDEMGNTPHIPMGNLAKLYWSSFFSDQIRANRDYTFPRVDGTKKFVIGINWRGGLTEAARKQRSIPIDFFETLPILKNPNCTVIPLQYDSTPEEIKQLNKMFGGNNGFLNYDPTEDVDSWAADIRRCDVLISIYNSAVPIAGEYNIPSLVLLGADPDPIWGKEQDSSDWYESVRLIRGATAMPPAELALEINRYLKELFGYQSDVSYQKEQRTQSSSNETYTLNRSPIIKEKYYPHDVIRMLRDRDDDLVGIELGVTDGNFSKKMVKSRAFQHFYGVNLFTDQQATSGYVSALKNVGICDNYSLLRMSLEEAENFFEDNEFDFIYVGSGAYENEEISSTLSRWFSKLKVGGIFAGVAYHEDQPPIKKTVDDMVAHLNCPIYLTGSQENAETNCYQTWFIRKEVGMTYEVDKNIESSVRKTQKGTINASSSEVSISPDNLIRFIKLVKDEHPALSKLCLDILMQD